MSGGGCQRGGIQGKKHEKKRDYHCDIQILKEKKHTIGIVQKGREGEEEEESSGWQKTEAGQETSLVKEKNHLKEAH